MTDELADNGLVDPNAPDSDFDRDLGQMICVRVYNGIPKKIYVNDFVDCENLSLDPIWGSSYQVVGFAGLDILIRLYDWATETYSIVAMSPEKIINNYMREVDADESELTEL